MAPTLETLVAQKQSLDLELCALRDMGRALVMSDDALLPRVCRLCEQTQTFDRDIAALDGDDR